MQRTRLQTGPLVRFAPAAQGRRIQESEGHPAFEGKIEAIPRMFLRLKLSHRAGVCVCRVVRPGHRGATAPPASRVPVPLRAGPTRGRRFGG